MRRSRAPKPSASRPRKPATTSATTPLKSASSSSATCVTSGPKTSMRISALLVLLACERGTPAPAPDPTGAESVVKRYFAAAAARDCPALQRLAAGSLAVTLEGPNCQKVVDEYTSTRMTL